MEPIEAGPGSLGDSKPVTQAGIAAAIEALLSLLLGIGGYLGNRTGEGTAFVLVNCAALLLVLAQAFRGGSKVGVGAVLVLHVVLCDMSLTIIDWPATVAAFFLFGFFLVRGASVVFRHR